MNEMPKMTETTEALIERWNIIMPLKQLRQAQGITQRDLAAAMGCGQATISELENSNNMMLKSLQAYVAGLMQLGGPSIRLALVTTDVKDDVTRAYLRIIEHLRDVGMTIAATEVLNLMYGDDE